ncbi:MAG: 3-isopropylmalate dehydratase large subunit [Pyrinomonadaceae bacterium]
MSKSARTLYDKIWDAHVVPTTGNGPSLVYIDLHLIHEVTSPQAFEGLRLQNRKVRRPDLTFGTVDHAIPTIGRNLPFNDPIAAKQVETLRENTARNSIEFHDLDSAKQGIIHVIAPESGRILPGMTIVCGDSHTSTHGAFGALAFGIGTSEVEHVLATQTLRLSKSSNYRIKLVGRLPRHVSPKDMALGIINRIGTAGGTGHVIEYAGEAVESLSMEGRMTLCNLSIEAGARAGMIAPDSVTFEYLREKLRISNERDWERMVERWMTLATEPDAVFERESVFDVAGFAPMITWGTSPSMSVSVSDPLPELPDDSAVAASYEKAYRYMGLEPGQKLGDIAVDRVFIGSCTNGRIEDLRAAAEVVKGKCVAGNVSAMVVPGSMPVKRMAEEEGLAEIFIDAGFEWRDAGCSMCLGMNEDILSPGERCASTSNRNFEGRQGRGGRTHLVSPQMAAAAAIAGKFVDIREF